MTIKSLLIAVLATSVALVAGCNSVQSEQAADTIYTGGDIVTVNDSQPTAEAVAIKNGKILMVGSLAEVERSHKGACHPDGRSRRQNSHAWFHRSAQPLQRFAFHGGSR